MNDIILKADRVLVGEDLNLKEHMAVIVRDGKIEEIVPQAECPAVEGAEVIDLKNTTLMPGMIECHNHLSIDATIPEHLELLAWSTECELTLIALDGFRKDLMSGVTTARCMGDRFYIDVTLKKLIEQGKVEGPKLLAAGIGMKGSHGAGYIGSPHCGPEEIRKTARENLKKGVDLLKLFITPGVPDPESEFVPSFLSLEEIAMAVSEAARKNLPVAAHCIGGQGLKDCIDGGVQVIEHMYMCTPQDAEWLANSKCIVDFTSGIFLDPTREETLSANNAYRVRKNRPRVPGKTEASDEYRCSVCSGNRCLPWLSVPRGRICGRARFRYCDRIKGCYLQCREGLRTGRPDRKLKERLCRRYHCSGWKSADGCGVPGKRTVCHAGWQHCETEVKRL